MFSPRDTPSKSAPGNGQAYIQLQLQFERQKQRDNVTLTESSIEIATVRDSTLKIGYYDGNERWRCCTEELASKLNDKICNSSSVNRLIIQNKKVQVSAVTFPGDHTSATAHKSNAHFPVHESGPHILILSNCDPSLEGVDVSFKGHTIWMNPYGYLPATLYYFMPFFGSMALAYGVLAIFWLIFNIIHWKDIVTLQNYITCVLAVCLIENMVLYFDYTNFNQTGHRHEVTLVLGVLLTMTRRTISRMLIMAVSIGFAIVRPDLGKNKKHIINFGLVYFCLGLTQQILIDLAKVHTSISDRWRTLLAIPVAAADSGCYWFIFISLYHLITMLRVRQQLVKLSVYKTFTKVLVFSLICATIFSCYHLYLTSTHQVISSWRVWWFLDEGVWNILFSLIFFAICFLFRPSQSAKRYAYSQISTDMADDEFGLEDGGLEMEEMDDDEPLFTLGDEEGEVVVDKKSAKVD